MGVAYETNPELDSARAGQKATDEGVAQAEANWRPSVNLQGSYGYETLSEASGQPRLPQSTSVSHPIASGVQLTENIYRGGRTAAEISNPYVRKW